MTKKIAVLRANALGDFIFILPALHALRDLYPQAEIVLLGKELHKELLSDRPSPVDRVEVIPPYPGVGEKEDTDVNHAAIESFFIRMQEERFDIAFQMHGGGRWSNKFVKRMGARLTVGSGTPDSVALDITIPYATYFSEILRYLELVCQVGGKPSVLEPRLIVTGKDRIAASAMLENTMGKPVAVIQPGARDPRRRWPAENFAQVADALVTQGFHVCFNGIASEQIVVREILDAMATAGPVQDFSGKLPLSALVGLLSGAAIIISNDTGPLYLAHAVGTPAVGLYWAPNMITGTPMRLKDIRPLIAWNMNCPLCGQGFRDQPKTDCDHAVSFIREIPVNEVLEAVSGLTKGRRKVFTDLTLIDGV